MYDGGVGDGEVLTHRSGDDPSPLTLGFLCEERSQTHSIRLIQMTDGVRRGVGSQRAGRVSEWLLHAAVGLGRGCVLGYPACQLFLGGRSSDGAPSPLCASSGRSLA